MFAIAFDLVVAETARHHPKGVSQAYADIGAITARKALPWLPDSVRDIRAFRVDQWSDFTRMVKGL